VGWRSHWGEMRSDRPACLAERLISATTLCVDIDSTRRETTRGAPGATSRMALSASLDISSTSGYLHARHSSFGLKPDAGMFAAGPRPGLGGSTDKDIIALT
jgi:hypothetical protein